MVAGIRYYSQPKPVTPNPILRYDFLKNKYGIIDYDINFEQKRNFAGVHFRIQDATNYEEFYLRPHQSGNPDAMQYSPVINGNAAWQLYGGEGYGAVKNYRFGEWMHVRLVIKDRQMDVFIDDMDTPILQTNDLKLDPAAGPLGFGTFLGAAYYANPTYQKTDNATLSGNRKPPPEPS